MRRLFKRKALRSSTTKTTKVNVSLLSATGYLCWIAVVLKVALFAAPGQSCGQAPATFEPLSIDRPDVSNLPTTIRPGHYQFELGSERGHGKSLREFHLPNMVFRTGLNRKSELRIGYDYIKLDSLGNGDNDGLMLGTIGGKYRFVEEQGSRPSVALQGEFALPFGSGADFNYNHVDYGLAAWSLLLLLNNTVHEQVFINYNSGAFWSRVD